MKNKHKILLRSGLLSIIAILMICTLNTFFQPVWFEVNNYHTIKDFYEEPKNRIETLFLGSSVGAYGYSPMELYKEYGICAYSVSTDAQPMIASYAWLEETYRLHPETLKNVVLDVSEFRKEANDTSIHKAFDKMKLSLPKIKAILEYGNGDFNKTLSFLMPLTLYHSRWKELEITDFEKYSFDEINGTRGYEFTLMHYISTVSDVNELSVPATVLNEFAEPAELLEKPTEYFYRIYEFCKEKGLTLTLVKTPTDYWNSNYNRAVQKIADELGLTFLDFNFKPLVDEIGYIHPYDSRESRHLNYYGTLKFMSYIGKYLKENCPYTDVRGNEKYAYMEEQQKRYDSIYVKKFEISQTEDISAALKCMLEDNNTVFITVKEDGAKNLTAAQREYLRSIGLEKLSALNENDRYIGIITKDGVMYEETGAKDKTIKYETILTDKTKVSLLSGKDGEKYKASCIIDGEELAKNTRGINLTVYNNDYCEHVYSVSFDTNYSAKRNVYFFDYNEIVKDSKTAEKYKTSPYLKNIMSYVKLTENTNIAAKNTYIHENNDLFGFLDKFLAYENTVLIISVKDEAATKLDERDRELFKQYGLTKLSELKVRDSYIAVIEDGKVTFEESSADKTPISFTKDNITVKSAGFNAGKISSVLINGKEHSLNIRGINIVLYDKTEDKVITSAAFDTYSKEIKSTVK